MTNQSQEDICEITNKELPNIDVLEYAKIHGIKVKSETIDRVIPILIDNEPVGYTTNKD